MKKVNWVEIAVFYTIAVVVSAPFRLGLIHPELLLPLPYGLNAFYLVLRGIGPAVGFVFVVFLLRSKLNRTLSFWGANKMVSLCAILVLPLGLILVGVPTDTGMNSHLYGAMYGIVLILYALGEEYGWRGYLQEALAPMKMWAKVCVMAVLWYVWHLNFLRPEISLQSHIIHFIAILLGSWGLLKVTETTGSILFASAVHLSFNILSDVRGDFTGRLVVLIVSIAVWIGLMRYRLIQKRVSSS